MDVRTLSRTVGAACLIVGPLAMAVPVTLSEADLDGTAQLRLTAQHLGTANLTNVLLLAQILLVPAMIYAARLARRGAPTLAFFGGGISALAWLTGLMGLGAAGILVYHGAKLPDQAAAALLIDKVNADPVTGTLTLIFVLGHVVGMVLLGAALWRSHAIPVWAAALFVLYPLVHLGAHIGGSIAVDNASGVLLVVASVVCAIKIMQRPNGEWDLPTTAEPVALVARETAPVA
jgi:hypothetical protein